MFEVEAEFGVAGTLLDVGGGVAAEAPRIIVVLEMVGVLEGASHRHTLGCKREERYERYTLQDHVTKIYTYIYR